MNFLYLWKDKMITMNDFKRDYDFFGPKIDTAISKVVNSGWYILGKEVESFEKKFAEFNEVKYCVGVGNGMDALQISLLALGIGPGDEVITTAHSAVATALAITATGATPIFVDIDEFYHIDTTKIEEAITNKTKAILPVHLYGQVTNIDSIVAIARKNNLFVVEDSCQAHGAELNGKKAGSFGDVGCFSFYPTKNLGAIGDGGALITNNEDIYKKAKLLRNYGQETRYIHLVKGLNSRLDELHAATLSVKLEHLEDLIFRRNERANWYHELLNGIPNIQLPKVRDNALHSFHLYVVKVENRDELIKHLKAMGIESIVHYPTPIHKQPCYSEYSEVDLPVTENAANTILSLPIHPFISKKEIEVVASAIKKFYEKQ